MKNHRTRHRLRLLGLSLLAVTMAGCQVVPDEAMSCPADRVLDVGFRQPPRVRYGAYPMAVLGAPVAGPELGSHSYYLSLAEKNGVAYTCRGGHVDTLHVRIAADWTAYLAARTYQHLMSHDAGFTYRMAVDRSWAHVRFSYPADWDRLPEARRRAVAREVALAVGSYLAFTMNTWHEIITWFGYKSVGLPSEFPSAFSWEDSYSNVLGTIVGVRALRDSKHTYNQAVKIALDEEMQKLGIEPTSVARHVSRMIEHDWYTGKTIVSVDIKMRNFDIGLGDGYITPMLIPDVAQCLDARPVSYPVPNLDPLAKHGFALSLEIEPHEWERHKPLRIVYGDRPGTRIRPETDFPLLMDHICRRAAAKWGPQYGAARELQEQARYSARR
jgi:hypothetical protein